MSGGHPNRNKRGGGARSRHGPPRQTGGKSASVGSNGASGANGSNGNGSNGNGSANGANGASSKHVVSIPTKAPAAPVIVRPPQPQPTQPTQPAQPTQVTHPTQPTQAARIVPTTSRAAPTPHQAPHERAETPQEPAAPFVVERAPDETATGKGQPAQARAVERQAPRTRVERFYAPGQNARNTSGSRVDRSNQHTQYSQRTHQADNGSTGANDSSASPASPYGAGSPDPQRFPTSADMMEPYPPRAAHNGAHSGAGNGYTQALSGSVSFAGMARDEDDDTGDTIVKPPPRDEVGKLIDALHTIFEQDRAISSQGNNQRCGICFLHYPAGELEYREGEGYYVCPTCKRSLGNAQLVMVRRQQR